MRALESFPGAPEGERREEAGGRSIGAFGRISEGVLKGFPSSRRLLAANCCVCNVKQHGNGYQRDVVLKENRIANSNRMIRAAFI